MASRGQFSLGGTLGAGAGTAYRMLRGRPGRNRKLLSAAQSGVRGFAKPVAHVLRILFLEVSGFFFLFFSLAVGTACWREYHKYQMHEVGAGPVVLAAFVGVTFFYFGVSSFWRARRKRSRPDPT